jgi:hypothetical protein
MLPNAPRNASSILNPAIAVRFSVGWPGSKVLRDPGKPASGGRRVAGVEVLRAPGAACGDYRVRFQWVRRGFGVPQPRPPKRRVLGVPRLRPHGSGMPVAFWAGCRGAFFWATLSAVNTPQRTFPGLYVPVSARHCPHLDRNSLRNRCFSASRAPTRAMDPGRHGCCCGKGADTESGPCSSGMQARRRGPQRDRFTGHADEPTVRCAPDPEPSARRRSLQSTAASPPGLPRPGRELPSASRRGKMARSVLGQRA